MRGRLRSLEAHVQKALDRPIPTVVYEPPSALPAVQAISQTLERLGLRIDDPGGDALPRPVRIDFTYSHEMKGPPFGATVEIAQSIPCFIDDDLLAGGVPALIRLFEEALHRQDLSLNDVALTDVRLTRFVQPARPTP